MNRRTNLNIWLLVWVLVAVFALLQFCCGSVWARPTTAYEAQQAATGWLRVDPQPLDAVLGGQVAKVETFNDVDGQPVYYVVYLEPAGFVIMPADDLVEPIVGFADDGTYDPSPANPLGALVTNDLRGRIAAVREVKGLEAPGRMQEAVKSQAKWGRLISLADAPEDEVVPQGLGSISDVRVAPLVQSRWSQSSVCGGYCYNHYTPNHYVCGCVATAMAQLMRYHQHPSSGIGVHGFTIKVDNVQQTAYTLGGDGSGGPYNWSQMPLVPNCSLTTSQRQAIGALCYDAGVSVNMSYTSSSSATDTLKAKDALTTTFKYGNAIKAYNSGYDIGAGLVGMINPNLDGRYPVILGITGGAGGHAVVCDGYGYHSSTMYHHLNMGWAGSDDAWYDLPNIDSSPAFNSVYKCVYNIRVSAAGDGEVISGRVLYPNGDPIPNATVYVTGEPPPPTSTRGLDCQSGGLFAFTRTDSSGIYAFSDLNSDTTYLLTAVARGRKPSSQNVTTGASQDWQATSGNVWGVDFPLVIPLDRFYVDDDAPGDPGPGDPTVSDPFEDGSGQHPFDSIAEALNLAIEIGCDEVEVAPGTYYEAINFSGKAIRLYSSGGPDVTIINGTGHYHVVECANGEGPDTVLDGFTITGGTANGAWPDCHGGGMWNNLTTPTVTNCIFTGNTANEYGGGMFNHYCSPTVVNCTFSSNTANGHGGGMHNYYSSPKVTNCTFSGNAAVYYYGGGMCNYYSNPTVMDCNFSGNSAEGGGGAMHNDNSSPTVSNSELTGNMADYGAAMSNYWYSSASVSNCTFSGNAAGNSGGGLYNYESSPTVTGCAFRSNTADWGGGGMDSTSSSPTVSNCRFNGNSADSGAGMDSTSSTPTVTNCMFFSNAAEWDGGGMKNWESSPIMTNCTFVNNSADNRGGGMYNAYNSHPTVTNCILWDDTPNEIYNSSSNPTVTYSDVQGGTGLSWFGTGCIDADPCFVDADNPDPNLCSLRLKPDSPCVDAGDNNEPGLPATDLEGNPRILDGDCDDIAVVDMGAYEFDYASIGDLNYNCRVDFFDFGWFSLHWGESSCGCFWDQFEQYDPSVYTFENSYGGGGSYEVSGGKLKIKTGDDNTASVITSGAVTFGVGGTLSLEVPPVASNEGVFMMCSTTDGQPGGNSTFGFRFRRDAASYARMHLYPPGTILADTVDPDPSQPATLCVERTSDTDFSYSIIIHGAKTMLGSFSLPELAGIIDLHIGAQAYDVSSDIFEFDNLQVHKCRCGGANLDGDENVDWDDLRVLTDWWLVGTEPE